MSRHRVTLHDVAHLAQVSTATVSYVLNGTGKVGDTTRQRVLAAVEQLGYVPDIRARSLKSTRINVMALLFPYSETSMATSRYFRDITASVCAAASDQDYRVIVTLLRREKSLEGQLREISRSGLAGGLILAGPSPEEVETLARTLEKFPAVLLSATSSRPNLSYIDVDNRSGMHQAVEHLVQLGHRRIAYVTPNEADNHTVQRLEAYREAMRQMGLSDAVQICQVPIKLEREPALEPLLQDRPSAVIAFDDIRALQVHNFLTRREIRIPDEVALIGFDDEDFGQHISPRLTTIPQPFAQMGAMAAGHLIKLIETPNHPPCRFLFPMQILHRESCGPVLQPTNP